MEKIKCIACGIEKSLDLFTKDKRKTSGYSQPCRECKNNRAKEWVKNHSEKIKKSWKKSKQRPEYKKRKNELARSKRAKEKGFNSYTEYMSFILGQKEKRKQKIKAAREEKIQIKLRNKKTKEQLRIENNEKRKIQRKIDLQYKLLENIRARTRKILHIQSSNQQVIYHV